MSKVKIPVWQAYLYVEVFRVTELKDGFIFKTKRVGYAHRDRPKAEDEVYSAIPMSIIRPALAARGGNDEFELELMT